MGGLLIILSNMPYSAPGKALIAGGYLVLFPEYRAYCVALSSRMHSVAVKSDERVLTFHSPQFSTSTWSYDLDDVQPQKNPFLNAVVQVCGAYFGELCGGSIYIFSDAGFHSQHESTPMPDYPRFRTHRKSIGSVPKTGLGSSAALCVVATASIVEMMGRANDPHFTRIVHNIAQIAHCVAQGKVGSGFDVAVAVYGSVQYSRFTPTMIPKTITPESVRPVVDMKWDEWLERCALPPSVSVLMGDVRGGSETPAMVQKVLAWRDAKPEEAEPIWASLDGANNALVAALIRESEPHAIRICFDHIRAQLQAMTKLTGVPIEPESQTKLLDAAKSIDGVINGVVPGAGGSDAIFLLVESDKFDTAKQALSIDPRFAKVKWLSLHQEAVGLRREEASYPGVRAHSHS